MCSAHSSGNAMLCRGALEGCQQSQSLGRDVHALAPALHTVATRDMGALPSHSSVKVLLGLSAKGTWGTARQEQSWQCWAHGKARGAATG